MKIYLSPSQQYYNQYADGTTTEKDQCNRIAEACERALIRCGFEVKRAAVGTRTDDAIAASNAWGADLHIPIHTNAGGGSGCVVFVDALDNRHTKYAQPIYDAIAAITVANETYGVRTARYDEITRTRGLCVYVECEFHDNARDAQWIIDNVEALGEAICKGICTGAGAKYIAKTPAKPADEPKKNEQEETEMVRYKTIEEMPDWAQAEAKELVEIGALRGNGDATGYDITLDMLRDQIICLRMCKALIAAVPSVDKAALFEEFKKQLKLTVTVE